MDVEEKLKSKFFYGVGCRIAHARYTSSLRSDDADIKKIF